jgi:hypothetical protein
MQLNINNRAVVEHTETLAQLHRSALPLAIRATLNDAVFDVKTKTMPKKADETFERRQPNFFKANSRFDKAQGYNINSMKSTVGFVEGGLKGGNNYAVRDLEQQEHGGKIGGKTFIPLDNARRGNSKRGLVKPNNRLSKIKKIINARNSQGKNVKEKFIKAAIVAGKGGYVISGKNKTLFRVDSLVTHLKSRQTKLKVEPLYSFKRSRKIKTDEKYRHFFHDACLETGNKLELFYMRNAEKQINRLR